MRHNMYCRRRNINDLLFTCLRCIILFTLVDHVVLLCTPISDHFLAVFVIATLHFLWEYQLVALAIDLNL